MMKKIKCEQICNNDFRGTYLFISDYLKYVATHQTLIAHFACHFFSLVLKVITLLSLEIKGVWTLSSVLLVLLVE